MADNLSHLRNMKRRVTQAQSHGDMSAAEKVDVLENALNVFRAEVDMKLQIMQQILTTRNEQVTVQKKLLEREQVLYDTLLGHWKNTPKLAATGLSVNFSAGDIMGDENEENLSDPDYFEGDDVTPGPSSRKKSKSSLRKQRKSAKTFPKQKIQTKAERPDVETTEAVAMDNCTFPQGQDDGGDGTFAHTDDNNEWDVESEPRSPRVQVQMKNELEEEEDVSNDEFSNPDESTASSSKNKNPIWTHFTPDEDDPKYSTCEHCRKKISRGGIGNKANYTNMSSHLKRKHPIRHAEYVKKKLTSTLIPVNH